MQHRAKIVVFGIVGIISAILVFQLGVFVGYHKARYTMRWESAYRRNFTNPHAIVGEVVNATTSTLLIIGTDSVEKLVNVTEATRMPESVQIGMRVVVIGTPTDDGQVNAKIIRVFDHGASGNRMKRIRR